MLDEESTKHFQTSEGINIAYATNFDSYNPELPIAIFNYGLACNREHWRGQISFFEKNHFQLVLHDYRFHYQSTGTDDFADCNFKNIVKDLKELLDYLQVKKIFMIGHSMGVNISLQFAVNFPQMLSGMVLISGTVFPPPQVMFNSRITSLVMPCVNFFRKSFPNLFQQFWNSQADNPIGRKLVHRGGFNTQQVSEEFVAFYMKKMSELPNQLFFRLMEEMENHDILQHLEEIKTPILLMGGDRDYVFPFHLQKMLHRYLKSSELYIIKDGSHVPQVDFPEVINERIHHFLQRHHP